MPRQVGPVFIEGTFGDLIFYKLNGIYYVRQKPAKKKRKQMEADERYARTLQKADQFGRASDISKWVYYRYVVKAVRRHGLFGELTGLVNRRLQAGEEAEAVQAWLIAYCQGLVPGHATTTVATDTIPELTTPVAEDTTAPVMTENVVVPVAEQPCQQPLVPVHKSRNKKARYLSKWKVNRKGRLQLPKRLKVVSDMQYEATANCHPQDG